MADIEFKENKYDSSPLLKEEVKPESPLKNLLVDYVGNQHNPENDVVTVEMVVETLAVEFPEFVMALAEENFFRGYNQAMLDLEDTDDDGGGCDLEGYDHEESE
tara:strand:- start:599 stop:910 length:312 start_codon:yes stop_codon:yes gene_type:complete